MFQTFLHSATAFIQGRLFKDTGHAVGRGIVGVVLVLAAFFLLSTRVPLWVAAVLAGFVGGIVQPRLFRDLKYR